MSGGSEFAIATALLDGQDSGWSNLGLWPAADYAAACEILAHGVARAAALDHRDRVLELACGQGAGLALWHRQYGVSVVAGLDGQSAAVRAARERLPGVAVAEGRFDVWPLPGALSGSTFTAVLCVDAAYHAASPAAFAGVAARSLEAGGRLAFTTLLQGEAWKHGGLAARLLAACLRLARVPVVADESAWRRTLDEAGMQDVRVRHLDATVLNGFAEFVDTRAAGLPMSARLTPGWLKIRFTAALCRYAQRHRLLHYSLVLASRRPR